MYLELRKKTGDKFTADEFNQIVAAINAKVEQEAGKSLSDENFTAEEKAFLTTLATQDVVKMITDEVARALELKAHCPAPYQNFLRTSRTSFLTLLIRIILLTASMKSWISLVELPKRIPLKVCFRK